MTLTCLAYRATEDTIVRSINRIVPYESYLTPVMLGFLSYSYLLLEFIVLMVVKTCFVNRCFKGIWGWSRHLSSTKQLIFLIILHSFHQINEL